jgi:hypothetical protein
MCFEDALSTDYARFSTLHMIPYRCSSANAGFLEEQPVSATPELTRTYLKAAFDWLVPLQRPSRDRVFNRTPMPPNYPTSDRLLQRRQ